VIYSLVGDFDGSIHLLEAMIEIEPNNAMALNNLGYLRIEAGYDDEQTRQWIERAAELDSQSPPILDTLGWLRYKQGRFEDADDRPGALDLTERSIELAQDPSGEVHDHLGDILWRLGRRDDAVEAWRAAERILADEARRQEMVQTYRFVQERAWGVVVADPEAMYDRDYEVLLNDVRAKIETAEAGESPAIAPTFAEARD